MTSNKYWQERARRDKIKVIRTGEKGIDNLKRLLKLNLDDIENKIKEFYEKYGEGAKYAENLSYAEFQKYKAKLRAKAKRYPKDKTLQKIARQDVPKYRIDRLRALQTDLQMQLTEATAGQEKGIYKTLSDVGKVAQATTAARFKNVLDLEFNTIASKKMKQILSSDWSGATWSERLWKDRETVGEKLTDILERGIPQGTSLQKMSRELKQATGQSFNNAFRLIRTETAHVDGQVTLEGYKQAKEELGYQEYIYDAFLDSRTSKICRELDGKRFKIDDAVVGVNFPPMHPNCRSTTQLDEKSIDEDKIDYSQFFKDDFKPEKMQSNIDNFVDGVIDNKIKQNSINVGFITPNIVKNLKKEGINANNLEIELTYKRVQHALRDNKNPLQLVTPEQLKRIGYIIAQNDVYYDTIKNNLVYVAKLPKDEIINGRDWIKIPVNIYKKENKIATLSRISSSNILNDKRYKKIK